MLCWWKLLQLSSSSCDSFQQPRICPRSTGCFCQRLYSGYNDQILPLNIFKVFLQRNYFKMFFKMFLNVGDFFFLPTQSQVCALVRSTQELSSLHHHLLTENTLTGTVIFVLYWKQPRTKQFIYIILNRLTYLKGIFSY